MSQANVERFPRVHPFARAIVVVVLLCSATIARAGLYPPAAPPGSAFIRVFNATSQPRVMAQIGPKNLGKTAAFGASSYVFLPPGQYPVKVGTVTQNVTLKGSHCYTAALESDGKVHMFNERCFNSQLKSLIAIYNMIDGSTLSLRTTDGATVVDKVAANTSGQREVNPVKANLAVYSGSSKIANAKPVALERGSTYSLFVVGTRSRPVLIWING